MCAHTMEEKDKNSIRWDITSHGFASLSKDEAFIFRIVKGEESSFECMPECFRNFIY